MKLAQFDRLTQAALAEFTAPPHGFAFAKGTLHRELASGVRHVVVIDLHHRTKSTFRVIVGFNARVIAGDTPAADAGVYGTRYLDARGLSGQPAAFPCMDESSATRSLTTVNRALLDVALPWFATVETAAQMADAIEDHYPAIKGQLLLHAGQHGRASEWLAKHVAYLRAKGYAETDPAWIETQRLLQACAQ